MIRYQTQVNCPSGAAYYTDWIGGTSPSPFHPMSVNAIASPGVGVFGQVASVLNVSTFDKNFQYRLMQSRSVFRFTNSSSTDATITFYVFRARRDIPWNPDGVNTPIELLRQGWYTNGLTSNPSDQVLDQLISPYASTDFVRSFKIVRRKTYKLIAGQSSTFSYTNIHKGARLIRTSDYWAFSPSQSPAVMYSFRRGALNCIARIHGSIGVSTADDTLQSSAPVQIDGEWHNMYKFSGYTQPGTSYSIVGTALQSTGNKQIGHEPDDSTEASGFTSTTL